MFRFSSEIIKNHYFYEWHTELWLLAFQSGGIAGAAVDVILFPLDTLKTRLQSAKGFAKSGGFRAIYAGVASAASGSAPSGKARLRELLLLLV